MKALDGNLAALNRYEAEQDRIACMEAVYEAAGEAMVAAAQDPNHDYHGGDAVEMDLLLQWGGEVINGEDVPNDYWIAIAEGRDPNDDR